MKKSRKISLFQNSCFSRSEMAFMRYGMFVKVVELTLLFSFIRDTMANIFDIFLVYGPKFGKKRQFS